ncbi:MAG: hypothetical protein WBW61_11080 [Rhodanobacteraceae bacterium]
MRREEPGLTDLVAMLEDDEQFYREVWLMTENELERELYERKARTASAILADIREWQKQDPTNGDGDERAERRREFDRLFDRAFRAMIQNRTLGLTRSGEALRNELENTPLREAG